MHAHCSNTSFLILGNMPRVSKRKKLIEKLSTVNLQRRLYADLRFISSESDSIEDDLDAYYDMKLNEATTSRYSYHDRSYLKRNGRLCWDEYLNDFSTQVNNTKFLRLFWMSRKSFRQLHATLENCAGRGGILRDIGIFTPTWSFLDFTYINGLLAPICELWCRQHKNKQNLKIPLTMMV